MYIEIVVSAVLLRMCRALGIPSRQAVVDILLIVMVHDKHSTFSVSHFVKNTPEKKLTDS